MSQILSTDISRRSLLQGAAATAVPGAILAQSSSKTGSAQVAARRTAGIPVMKAGQAEDLASAIGVVIHLHFGKSVYGQTDRVVDAVSDLGVRHVRNRITRTREVRRGFTELAKRGVQVNGVCGAFQDPQTMFQVMEEVVTAYDDPTKVFSAFEGINEPNNNGVPWIDETRSKTRQLFVQRNAHGLRSIPIVAPAMARVTAGGTQGRTTMEQSANLGDLSQYVDYGNIHCYPRGLAPSTDIDYFMKAQRQIAGNAPMMCTEGGYFTAMNYRGGAFPTPETAAAKYLPRQIMEHWTRGNKRFFVYELLDDFDASGAEREANFGLMNVTSNGPTGKWTPKAHYRAIQNFVSILGDKGPDFAPRGMRVQVTGVNDLQTVLVRKRDNSSYLLMWRDVNAYDPNRRQMLKVAGQTATVTFPNRRQVTLYSPTQSARPIQSFRRGTSVKIPVGDELLIAKID